MINKMNPFEQLMAWLEDGTLGRKQLLIAYRASVRNQKDIPEGARNLAEPLLRTIFRVAEEITGNLHLSYLRGTSE
jgi:hypothetical protein